ncbi:MAG: orotidine-5'-phosphate decarboxylase [Gammaproteobacteria bacterium]|nr:orotidine-5'-phosphate decarboxylase [Gammaproteobacteria bacterium]
MADFPQNAKGKDPRVIVALDVPSAAEALAFAGRVTPALCRLKVGLELFSAAGPGVVEQLAARGFDVFLDLKFHDIPTTVARACAAAARLGVWMLNVHALGGTQMLEAARSALEKVPSRRPLLIGVTVLTSQGAGTLSEIGLDADPAAQVLRLAGLVQKAGLDGIVCSAQESGILRVRFGTGFLLVTPGIRPAGTASHDQQRTMTPLAAVRQGADFLVIGRPITQAADPVATLEAIDHELRTPF